VAISARRLAIWQASWDEAVRLTVIAVLAVAYTYMFVPRGAEAMSAAPPQIAPSLVFLGMMATMTIPMAAWMRYRGHRWQPTLEMAGPMIIPTLIAIALLATGFMSFGALMGLEHIALLGMLLRVDEYTSHALHAIAA
jgi:hypothetical protein